MFSISTSTRTATTRQFSTTSQCSKLYAHVTRRKVAKTEPLQEGDPVFKLPREIPQFPPYPYGNSTYYKQSDRGLYGGKVIQFGHKISEFKNRNVRTFEPNVNRQTLWSQVLNQRITLKVTASTLKAIDKEGGLDNYLVKDTSARIKQLGPLGWKLRYLVLSEIQRREDNKTAKELRQAVKDMEVEDAVL